MKRTPCSCCGFLHRYTEPLPLGKKAVCKNCSSTFVIESGLETPDGVKFLTLDVDGVGSTDCVGESHYLKNMNDYFNKQRWEPKEQAEFTEHTCTLVPERGNEHDPNAVRVEVGGFHVAYLSRRDAALHREFLNDTGKPFWQLRVQGTILACWDENVETPALKYFSVQLHVSWSDVN